MDGVWPWDTRLKAFDILIVGVRKCQPMAKIDLNLFGLVILILGDV